MCVDFNDLQELCVFSLHLMNVRTICLTVASNILDVRACFYVKGKNFPSVSEDARCQVLNIKVTYWL